MAQSVKPVKEGFKREKYPVGMERTGTDMTRVEDLDPFFSHAKPSIGTEIKGSETT